MVAEEVAEEDLTEYQAVVEGVGYPEMAAEEADYQLAAAEGEDLEGEAVVSQPGAFSDP